VAALSASPAVRRKRFLQNVVFSMTGLATLVVAAPVVIVTIYVIDQGASAISPEFLFDGPARAGREGGFWPVIILTLYALVLTAAIAVPIGVAAAIYLAEYARDGLLLRVINLTIVNLAGVPSIVYGLFGAALFLDVVGAEKTLWVASATLAIQALAIVITSSREALTQVPAGLREGSLALGVSKLRTTLFITLPQAFPGIITGVLLAISRAAGETAPILVVGAILATNTSLNPTDAVTGRAQMLSFELYGRITEGLGFEEDRKWAIGLVLLALVLVLNISALILRFRIQRASRG
jgi:phosphate transport system permease protein